jgi:hypothetical protein
MSAQVAAAVAAVFEKFGGQDHQSVFEIEINVLDQRGLSFLFFTLL